MALEGLTDELGAASPLSALKRGVGARASPNAAFPPQVRSQRRCVTRSDLAGEDVPIAVGSQQRVLTATSARPPRACVSELEDRNGIPVLRWSSHRVNKRSCGREAEYETASRSAIFAASRPCRWRAQPVGPLSGWACRSNVCESGPCRSRNGSDHLQQLRRDDLLREPILGSFRNTNSASWFGDPGKRYYARRRNINFVLTFNMLMPNGGSLFRDFGTVVLRGTGLYRGEQPIMNFAVTDATTTSC